MDSKKMAWDIRYNAIKMVNKAGASHIGSILSITDIVAVLYSQVLDFSKENYKNVSRDRLILSKGHAGVAIYVALALKGIIDIEELEHYCENGSNLSGHVSHKNVEGVEISTGSLGHGLPMAVGTALALKKKEIFNSVYCIVGDGECNEGAIWEAALFASHNNLSNLTVIVDSNKIQAMGLCKEILNMDSLDEKWRTFGFNVIQIDGHNHNEIYNACVQRVSNNKPKCIIANTVKGKGISFMENNLLWHYRNPKDEVFDMAIKELMEEKNENNICK